MLLYFIPRGVVMIFKFNEKRHGHYIVITLEVIAEYKTKYEVTIYKDLWQNYLRDISLSKKIFLETFLFTGQELDTSTLIIDQLYHLEEFRNRLFLWRVALEIEH